MSAEILPDGVSPVRMVSAKNVTGPALEDAIGLRGPQLTGLSEYQLEKIKGEKTNLTANLLPTPIDVDKLTTDNDANLRAGTCK